MEGDMVVRKYEGYSGRMIRGTLSERWGGGGYAGHYRGGYAGHYRRDGVGYDGRMIRGTLSRGICGTDHLPEIGPAGPPFLVPPPPIHEERETGTANDLRV